MKVDERKFKFNLQLFGEDDSKKVEDEGEKKTEPKEDLTAKELEVLKTEKQLLEKKLENMNSEIKTKKELEDKLKQMEQEKKDLEEAIKKSKDESLQKSLAEREKLDEQEKRMKREQETLDALERERVEKERIEKEAKEREKEFQNKILKMQFENDLKFEKLQKPWLADILDKIENEADYASFKKFYPEDKQKQLQKDYESKKEAGSLYKHTEVSEDNIPKDKNEEVKLTRAQQRIQDIINKKRN